MHNELQDSNSEGTPRSDDATAAQLSVFGDEVPTSDARAPKRATMRTGSPSGRRTRRPAESQAETGLDGGSELEMRLARVMFWEGSYTKQGVDMQRHFGPEPISVTDIDVLAYNISPQFRGLKTVCEAKSGTGKSSPSPLDRTIWLMGVMKLVGAESAELVTARPPRDQVRALASTVNVRAYSAEDLAFRETAAHVDQVTDVGAHGAQAVAAVAEAHKRLKLEPTLERAYWFLRSEVWFLDDWAAVKRTLGLLASIRRWWTPQLEDPDMRALRWVYAEAVSVFTLRTILLLREGLTREPASWTAFVHERLAEGAVPIHQMRRIAAGVDDFVAKVLGRISAPIDVKTEAMGAFVPRPPSWADEYAELTTRLISLPLATGAPRYIDALLHQRLVKQRELPSEAELLLNPGPDSLGRVRRTISAFLRGAVDLPKEVDQAISE